VAHSGLISEYDIQRQVRGAESPLSSVLRSKLHCDKAALAGNRHEKYVLWTYGNTIDARRRDFMSQVNFCASLLENLNTCINPPPVRIANSDLRSCK
jgi:hypothetical protein